MTNKLQTSLLERKMSKKASILLTTILLKMHILLSLSRIDSYTLTALRLCLLSSIVEP